VIKMNGEAHEKVLKLYGEELASVEQLFDLIKSQLHYKKTPHSCIYSQQGIKLYDDDVIYLRDGDTLYYDYKGREFEPTQIVDQYQKEELLGQGGFGKVFRAKHKETGQLVALKYIDLTDLQKSANTIQDIDREAKILKMLNHKNIIKLYQAFVLKNQLLLIMEYADGGELIQYVEEKKGLEELEIR